MTELSHNGSAFWPMACPLLALVAAYAFFQDIIKPDWPAWFIAPALVLAFRGAVSIAPEESFMRAALYQVALIVVPFMGIFGIVDAVTTADWPEWVIATSVVLAFWVAVFLFTDVQAE